MFKIHQLPEPLTWHTLSVLLSSGFGSGAFKPGSGTWGSLACLALLWPFWLEIGMRERCALIFLLTFLIMWALRDISWRLRAPVGDRQWIVSDEFLGLMIAMLAAQSFYGMIAAFALFRVFDIWKPGPVKAAEKWGDEEVGIVMDDVVAGLIAFFGVWALETYAF